MSFLENLLNQGTFLGNSVVPDWILGRKQPRRPSAEKMPPGEGRLHILMKHVIFSKGYGAIH